MGVVWPITARVPTWQAPHGVAIPAPLPAVTIGASTIAAATVLTTLTPHHFVSGDTVLIAGHLGSTPAVDGSRIVTVIDALHFSIPVNVTVAGAGGTATRTLAVGPLTLTQGKLRAGLDWADGDARDALMLGFLATAWRQVESDTGVALLPQAYGLLYDSVPRGRPIELPWRPVQSVTVASIDSAGVTHTLADVDVILDPGSAAPIAARVSLGQLTVWPSDLRRFQPWLLELVVGFPSVDALTAAAPGLVHAVGLLTAHYATLGRDLATIDPMSDVPYGYRDTIAPYQIVSLA